MKQKIRLHRYLYNHNSWLLLCLYTCKALSEKDVEAVDGSHPIGMVDEVTFKVIPGYAAKGRRFSHVSFKEVNVCP